VWLPADPQGLLSAVPVSQEEEEKEEEEEVRVSEEEGQDGPVPPLNCAAQASDGRATREP